MNLKLFIILFTSLFLLAATDINNGKDKSATCAACHGKEGNSQVGLWPSIAGQNKNYLMKQLKLIKKGERAIPFSFFNQILKEWISYKSLL